MTALLLDPHGDDAALFAAYTCQREKPFVMVTHRTVPSDEITDALLALGCTRVIYDPDYPPEADVVYAPAYHEDGHYEHNDVAVWAGDNYENVISYCTYAPRAVRQTGTLVEPEWWMIAPKLRALSCFVSQIEQESTRPWFTSLLDLREWTA